MAWNTQLQLIRSKTSGKFDSQRAAGGATTQEGMDLAEIGRILLRRKWLTMATIILLMGSGIAVTSSLIPRYTAEALLMVGDQQPHMLDLQSVVTSADAELTESEIQIVNLVALHA